MEKNWESYDKPNYKRMMADGYDMAMPLIISIDTSGSTMMKYKEGVFDFDTINAQYRKVAISAIDNLSPSEVVIFDHNMTVEQVFAGNQYDAVQFIRDKNNLQPRNGTAPMSEIIDKVMGLTGNKLVLTDMEFYNAEQFEGEGAGCGCPTTKNAEEPVVQEPDWIPDGDGRAIGQQDFAINLSPLHAETVRKTGMMKMQKKGMNAEHKSMKISYDGAKDFADEIGGYVDDRNEEGEYPMDYAEFKEDVVDEMGRHLDYEETLAEIYDADTVGNPSPTFNEDITGQDGPSSQPTNATFEAMMTYAPSSRDVDMARRDLKNSGYGDVVYDRYMVNRDGSSNKFYYTAVTEKDGKYYPMGSYGRIGYYSKLFNIMGKKESPRASTGSFEQAYRQCRAKENAKIKRNYVDYTLQMAEEFRAYEDSISDRQRYRIQKLGGKVEKSMSRSDASDYIKELMGKESGTWESETLAEIEGPTAEATEGGLHSPSSFAMTWENEVGTSSPSMPPNEIAWAEDVKGSESFVMGSIYAIGLAAIGLTALIKFGSKKKNDTASGDDTKNAEKGCGCAKTPKKVVSVKESEYSVRSN